MRVDLMQAVGGDLPAQVAGNAGRIASHNGKLELQIRPVAVQVEEQGGQEAGKESVMLRRQLQVRVTRHCGRHCCAPQDAEQRLEARAGEVGGLRAETKQLQAEVINLQSLLDLDTEECTLKEIAIQKEVIIGTAI